MNGVVVFYDGDCGFCNRSVQFILDHEKKSEIQFCALQSPAAVRFFESQNLEKPNLSTFYFWNGKRMLDRSSGAIAVAGFLKFPFQLLKCFWIIHKFLRDAVYNAVAKRRTRFFKSCCVIPSEEQKVRFIN